VGDDGQEAEVILGAKVIDAQSHIAQAGDLRVEFPFDVARSERRLCPGPKYVAWLSRKFTVGPGERRYRFRCCHRNAPNQGKLSADTQTGGLVQIGFDCL